MDKKKLTLEVIKLLAAEYPDADCTLDYDEAWKLLVSVRLAAQCTDARVNVIVEDLYNYLPDDHYSVCGASMQKYLAGEIDRAGLADEITKYWSTAQVGAH